MEIIKLKDLLNNGEHQTVLSIFNQDVKDGRITMGTATILPGERVPKEGASKHRENEYSVIVKGSIVTKTGGKTVIVKSGEATFIPAWQEHVSYNESEESCEVVWVLVG